MNFDAVEKIAAAILYEGYILYPYRKTAIKNRQRWNFGTLYPRVYAKAQRPEEPWHLVVECLIEASADDATLNLKLQFLHLMPTSLLAANMAIHRSVDPPATPPRDLAATAPGAPSIAQLADPSLAWEEALECNSELKHLRVKDLIDSALTLTLPVSASPSAVPNTEPPEGLEPLLTVTARPLPGGLIKIRIELQNATALLSGGKASRKEVLPKSFVSAHILLGITGGQFISLLDPPIAHVDAVAGCSNVGVFPVLAGAEPDRSLMLCSPIILYDYPRIAPESEGDFFDGTEMDEMLTLRVLTLTDAEKEEMRQGDPRARHILERTESLTGDAMLRAHGVVRSLRDTREIQEDAP